MKLIATKCTGCGKNIDVEKYRIKRSKNHFCSQSCNMKYLNKKLNKTRMTDDVKEKIRNARLGTGNGKAYKKLYGKHEHRVVAEKKLGRPLKPGEVVHHIDGNKFNNNPNNLQVLPSQAEHARLHFIKKEVVSHEPV